MHPSANPRRYLLVPPEPTPNGPLHLGHIAGPFLRLDVLARFLRMRGDHAAVITGTDAYESWVAMRARMEACEPAEIAARFHGQIREGLAAMRIEMDEYFNPAEEPWHTRFRQEIDGSLARLRDRGAISRVVERVPYDASADRFVVGPLLLGRCPDCAAETTGYGCEDCGAHFRPEELVEPRSRFAQDRWQWRQIETLFVEMAGLDWLEPEFDRLEVAPRYREAVRAYVRRSGTRDRLSAPHQWGMPLPTEYGLTHSTLFSYTGCFMFARLIGELHRERIGATVNSFDAESDVITVTSLGCDNAVCTLYSINALAPVFGGTRPYDRCLINEFYQLAGSKFSTSRGHVITASAIARVPGLPVDATRFYLAMVNPESEEASFEPKAFLEWVNARLAGDLERSLAVAWERVPGTPGPIAGAAMDQLRLAHPALAVDRDDRRRRVLPAQQVADGVHLRAPTDEAVRVRRQQARRRPAARRRVEQRTARPEHLPVDLGQLGTGREPQLGGHPPAQFLVGADGLLEAPGLEQRTHEEPAQPLVERLVAQCGTDQIDVARQPAVLALGLAQPGHGLHAQLLKPDALRPDQRTAEPVEGGQPGTPQLERRAVRGRGGNVPPLRQQRVGELHLALEVVGVAAVRAPAPAPAIAVAAVVVPVERELVSAVPLRPDPLLRTKTRSQWVDVLLQICPGAGRRVLRPEAVHQCVGAHRPSPANQEDRQQPVLHALLDVKDSIPVEYPHRPQDLVTQPPARGPRRSCRIVVHVDRLSTSDGHQTSGVRVLLRLKSALPRCFFSARFPEASGKLHDLLD